MDVGREAGRPRPVVVALLGTATGLSAFLILRLATNLTFVYDDWDLLVNRREWNVGSFMDPYHEHIVLGPTLVFKLLASTFGIGSATPFRIVAIAVFAASAIALFIWLRPRIGDWAALTGAGAILFLGGSFENLLWPVQIAYFGSVAAGIGMLIALDRDDRHGDRAACVLLTTSMAFSSFGFAFLAGGIVDLALGKRSRSARAFIVAVPIILYVLWYIGWGHNAQSEANLSNLADVPRYAFDAAAGGIVGLLGLATGDGSEPEQPHLIFGQLALVGLLGLAGWRLRSLRHLPRGLVVVAAIALAFWVLAALNQTGDRAPTSSRYLYPSGVFILLVAGELLRGIRIRPGALIAASAVTIAAAIGGISLMSDQYQERWITSSDYLRASLAAVEIARDGIDPRYPIVFGSTLTIPADAYLDAVGDRGFPGWSEEELTRADEVYRATADATLASALGLVLAKARPSRTEVGCETLRPALALSLGPGAVTLTNLGPGTGEIRLGRFASRLPVSFGRLPPESTSKLALPDDRSALPWRLGLVGDTSFSVCPVPIG